MPYCVYVLRSDKDGQLYVGMTQNLEDRLRRHNEGRATSTRSRRPFKLIFKESAENRIEVRKRERYWKSGVGREKIKEMAEPPTDIKGMSSGGQAR